TGSFAMGLGPMAAFMAYSRHEKHSPSSVKKCPSNRGNSNSTYPMFLSYSGYLKPKFIHLLERSFLMWSVRWKNAAFPILVSASTSSFLRSLFSNPNSCRNACHIGFKIFENQWLRDFPIVTF
ncbi:MAG: hypothetical protein AAF943_13730, partial [Pseudomonadota bacterium]